MDIEKLRKDLLENSDPDGPCIEDDLMQAAATALSTLQAENERLRAELENYRKGHREEAISALSPPNEPLTIEQLRAELEAKAARLGIAQDVKFLGVQSDTSVWYQAMDVFVMSSLFEGLPVVGMEAQASGLPCVFSTGVTEEVLLRPDSCRISLEQPDEAWAAVLKDADRDLPDRAQAAAQVRAAGYDIRQETLRLQQLYTGLIAKRGAAHA